MMKKCFALFSAFALVLGAVAAVQAGMCTPENPGSVDVTLTVDPAVVCPGDKLTISGTITNMGDCHEFYLIRLKLEFFYPETSDLILNFPGSAWCKPLTPKFLVPLVAGGNFDFSYSGVIPEVVPPGDYTLTVEARGTRGGTIDTASADFTLDPCLTQ